MARTKSNGNGRRDESITILNQSMASLNQAMATFLVRNAESDARIAKIEAENAKTFAQMDERFARIEAILIEHSRILRALPDAIREKIGFKHPEPKSSE